MPWRYAWDPRPCRRGGGSGGWIGRAWQDSSQDALAKRSNVSLSTMRDFEKGRRVPIANNLRAMRAALKAAGVELTHDPDSLHGKPEKASAPA
ncbi:MAG: helix-turn-helix transcriptional regulator [Methylobacterium frigidaeris]